MIVFATHVSSAYRLLAEINIEHLRELQRFAQVGRVSAGLIHDISSPLTAAILHLEQGDPRRMRNVRDARRSIKVLERYVEAARRQLSYQDEASVFSVRREACQVRHILEPLARRRKVCLIFDMRAGSCSLLGDPVKFQRIIMNLATNAMDAYAGDAVKVKPFVKIDLGIEGMSLVISIRDGGKGIKADQIPLLFKPFYTTKEPGPYDLGGTGIGLSIARHYAEDIFGGTIKVITEENKGTELKVILPLHSRERG